MPRRTHEKYARIAENRSGGWQINTFAMIAPKN